MLVQTYDTIRTMQVLQLAVSRGFTRWTGGRVRYDRAEGLVAKFEELYAANPDRAQDMRLRRAGHARSRLVLYPQDREIHFSWWLLVSEGTGAVVQREKLADATDRKQRITLRDWELLRMPKRQAKESVAWTWRLPEKVFRDRLAHACAVATHDSPHQAQTLLAAMAQWPGFHGISHQRRDIQEAMAAARRAAGRPDALDAPAHPPWPRLLELRGHGVPLAIAVERMRRMTGPPK
jgi:hypothetical protein